ncbi:MAG: 50S ribosomal protein L11 methyltransferase [Lachnospiraceae bacterium]|nr:50S ribosomal protein L11 methyltransferase [Lachnospiraceae bacterium]
MKYTKIALKTTTEAVDFVSNLFDELGLEGIQIEDNIPLSEEDKKAMYIDILPELPEDDGSATVSSYFEPNKFDIEQLVNDIRNGLDEISNFVNIGEGTIEIDNTDDKDWINNWKAFFKPFRVADDIIIKPTWENLEHTEANDLVIEIDPGTAFGTGSHETTRLCILGLRKYINSTTELLDVGCGSGILSIIGLKLGAKHALGTDIDPNAVTATLENIEVNKISREQFTVLSGNIIEDAHLQQEVGLKKYDIVVANILADVIIPLSGTIQQHMKDDGLFISSGIINTKKLEVEQALLKNNFEIIETNEMGDWVSFVTRKRK